MGLNYNPTIVPDGLVMYFDPANSRSSIGSGNTIYDLSGNSNTCTFSATPTYDVASKGNLLLAGYGTVSHTDTLWSSNQFTLSVWAKKISGTRGIMISKDTNYIDHSYNGKTMVSFYATAAYSPRQYLLYGNTSANYNEWRHYTSTYDGTTGSLYENGALIGTTNMSVEILKSTDPFNIGRWNGGSINFSGHLGTIMTYNRALSAQEIKQNYDATKGRYIVPENIVTDGLVLNIDPSKNSSYPGTGSIIYDLSGFGNTGTLTNGPTFSGLNDGNIVFDGSNDYINFKNSNSLTFSTNNQISLAAWINTRTVAADTFIFYRNSTSATGYVFYLKNSGLAVQFGNGTTLYAIQSGISATSGYSYVTATLDGSSIKLYLNGTAIGSTTFTGTLYNTTADMSIGAANVSTRYFNGSIYSAYLYNRALTQQEVLQNYNATKYRFGL
jgi:hypothetical protein